MNLPLVILLIAIPVCSFSAEKASEGPKALNEVTTAAAWDAFNKDKFDEAIKAADKCIDEFLPTAKRMEEDLEKKKENIPNGAVSDTEKKKVFANGLLNDVATCLFIKGRSFEKLNKKEDAKSAYRVAKTLRHARAWDTSGWFWAPADAASDRLAVLN